MISRKNITLFLVLLFLVSVLFGCGVDDEERSDPSTIYTGLASWGLKIHADDSDNLYMAGISYGDISSDSGEGEADIFLAQYDTSGNRTWLVQETDFDDQDFATDFAVDGTSGNIYIAGYTDSNLETDANVGGFDIFVIKYNSSGVRQWIQQIGSIYDDFCWGIAIDDSENIYLTGSTYGVIPGSDVTNTSGIDLYLMKLNASGETQWVKQIEKETAINENVKSQSFGVALDIDASGDIILGGITNDVLGDSRIGNIDIILSKYDSSGTQSWITQLGTSYNDYIEDLEVFDTNGNIYLAGYSYGTIDASYDYDDYSENHNYTEMFLLKYNSSGDKVWVNQAGSEVNDWNLGLTVDSSENIYTAGRTVGDVSGDNIGSSDLVLMKYDSSGNRSWYIQAGSESYDSADSITVDSSDNIYIVGKTYGKLNSQENDNAVFSAFISNYDKSNGGWNWTDIFGKD